MEATTPLLLFNCLRHSRQTVCYKFCSDHYQTIFEVKTSLGTPWTDFLDSEKAGSSRSVNVSGKLRDIGGAELGRNRMFIEGYDYSFDNYSLFCLITNLLKYK